MKCIDIHVSVDLRVLWACYRIRQMSLSGFQRCRRQMLPKHFKGDIFLAFGLDHFQDMIRFQHTDGHWGENKVTKISLSRLYSLRRR